MNPIAAVLFDRDGTLIIDVPYLTDPDGVRPVSQARSVLDQLRSQGIAVGVVSNQSGVARGLITDDQLDRVNARVEQLLGPFDTWQVCRHGPKDGCGCRKPKPGLIINAARDLGLDPSQCLVVGDIGADIVAALAAGAQAVLVPTPATVPDEIIFAEQYAAVTRTLDQGVRAVLEQPVLTTRGSTR
jgi:histidinol-phosphate phosphatase family protein